KRYQGSTYKTKKYDAQKYADEINEEIRSTTNSKGKSAKAQDRSLADFREKITEEIKGPSINLSEVWDTFRLEAPAVMKRQPNENGWKAKESYWRDFMAFLSKNHPSLKTLREVAPAHAKEYVAHIKTKGKFQKTISYKGRSYNSKLTKLAPGTVNEYITQIKQIFTVLFDTAGLIHNPFERIPLVSNKKKGRFVFEINELEKINAYLKGEKARPNKTTTEVLDFKINEALFVIGINTGLRRGDMCQLQWRDMNFFNKTISTVLGKTGENVCIPMTTILYEFLKVKESEKINS
ncbi:MAG: integrase, partial [Chlamydiales bacterium]